MDAVTLDAPVASVTLFEDRALVGRRGRVALPAGPSRLCLAKVSPLIVDRSLRVALSSTTGPAPQTSEAHVRRERVAREADLPGALPALRAEERALAERQREGEQRLAVRRAEVEDLRLALAQRLAEAVVDGAWGACHPDLLAGDLGALRGRERDLLAEITELGWSQADTARDLDQLRRRIEALRNPATAFEASVQLSVVLAEPAEIEVELGYLVPNACWRPRYRATLTRGPAPTLEVEVQAAVWQRTGEEWRDVALTFSTERPSLGSEPPRLAEDLLRARPRGEAVVIETREQAVETTGLGQAREADDELPGVDDGGEPIALRAEAPATVIGDGRPHRVALGRFSSPARCDRLVAAERAALAIQRCAATNLGPWPLLAGPVDLLARSGRIGRGQVGFVAPQERFELGFGPDPTVRVFRRDERTEHEPGPLSRWRATEHRVELRLSSLGAEPVALLVQERVPVSELAQVEIEVHADGTTGEARPDADGLLSWEVDLPADGTRTVELHWTERRRSDVIER